MTTGPRLPYRKPRKGRDYWIHDDVLPDPEGVRARCLAREDWTLGFPHARETWPGMRIRDALTPDELAPIEAWVRKATGAERLWVQEAPGGARLDHNVAQLVARGESGPRPHTDSRRLCRHAAVIYLSPDPPPDTGTSFYRQRGQGRKRGGNYCPEPHANLVEALGISRLPLDAWQEDLRLPNVYNRMLLYRADLVHGATGYFGEAPRERRLTLVFFWMTAPPPDHLAATAG
jgi:hypothetical protein